MTTATPLERRNVAILAANQALFMVAAITVMTLSGLVGRRLAPHPSLATLPVAAMMIGVVLASLPGSLLMKRIGRRAGFVLGALVGAAGGAVAVGGIAASAFWVFCVGNLLLGVYQAFANYHRFAAADAASPAFESRAISLVLAGGVVAAFLGPLNASRAGRLLEDVPDAGPYAVIVVLALLGTGLHLALRIPRDEQARSGEQRSFRTIRRDPAFVVALLAATVGYAIMILVMTATPLAMQEAGYALSDAATVMQWHVLGMFAPSFVTGGLIARHGVRRVLLAGAGLVTGSVAVAVSGQAMGHFVAALVLLGVGWNLLFIGGSALLASTHTAAERGKVQGVNELVVFSAVAAGSLLAGVLLYAVGWRTLNLLMLPPLAITAATTWRWQRGRHAHRGADGDAADVSEVAEVSERRAGRGAGDARA